MVSSERTVRSNRLRSALLWTGALVIMLSSASWQRRTGPTYDYRGELALGNESHVYRLTRSAETTADALVSIPAELVGDGSARLFFRRYPTQDPYTGIPMERTGDVFVARLPRQPAAGKLAYYIEIVRNGREYTLPDFDDFPVIIRYKDPVAAYLLVPHIFLMFVGMLFGVRTALGALFLPETVRRWTFWTLGLITVGGLLFGPLVQNSAFGSYWTGWPFGGDLTDNKTLIMWLAWVAAAIFVRKPDVDARKRVIVFAAAVIMVGVYLVPHSLRGSQLDYEALDRGMDPTEAIDTGR